ncbi:phytanoyl-CoA dioxygenase family protein [Chloroflexi bacterium TSY]|nr:phytanoyl-CoA dioxygenase family protein [Chloroflexi bacterium TSY]
MTKTDTTQFARDGYFIVDEPVIPADLVTRAIDHMDAVMMGEYETGVPPYSRHWEPGDDPHAIRKIDLPHLADQTIYELFCHPAIGEWAARIMGAEMVQLWASQLLYKPPSSGKLGNVGWHQDKLYWPYWEGEVFTAWIALSDVTEESGAMRFVRGSHMWGGVIDGGDFFSPEHEAQREAIQVPEGESWEEVTAILPPGGLSLHHCHMFHGSGPNLTGRPRRSFALHLRTEKSTPKPGVEDYGYASRLDDPVANPVLYRAES